MRSRPSWTSCSSRSSALTIAFAPDYLLPRSLPVPEFAAVLLFAMTGAMLIAASTDLLLLFIGLELMVLPGYLLAGYHKTDSYSTEGAIKYFLLGSFSSAIFLFGLAFVWGMTGTTTVDGRGGPAREDRRGRGAVVARPGDGAGVPDDRRRVQDRGGAVPLLDAGRVPGLADTGHRLPVGRSEGRRVRADHPPVRRGALAAGRRVAADHPRPLDPDDEPRQPRRADPGQRQADAGVQLHRPHRLHAGRLRRVRRRPAGRARGPALLPRRLHVHEPRRVRGHLGHPEADRRHVGPRDVRRASSDANRSWPSCSRCSCCR